MMGLLLDVNVENLSELFPIMIEANGLADVTIQAGIGFYKLREFGMSSRTADRIIWDFCQQNELVLFTDNRNNDGVDALEQTLLDSLATECLPVISPGDKHRLKISRDYQVRVALAVADLLFGVYFEGRHRGVGRIFVP